MKAALRWFVLLALSAVVQAGDIKLRSGLVLREARIVQISEKLVTIVHRGGSMGVDPAEVDLEVLARAHLELEDETAGRAQRATAATAKAEERMARIEAQKAEQAKSAPASVGNRTGAAQAVQGKAPQSAGAGKVSRSTVSPSSRVLQLKAAFPPKSVGTANVFIPRSGQGARSYVVSSSGLISRMAGIFPQMWSNPGFRVGLNPSPTTCPHRMFGIGTAACCRRRPWKHFPARYS